MRIGLPIISFLVLPFLLLPLPSHWRARNIATLTIFTVLFLMNVIHGVNSIVWAGSIVPKLHVWCDITTKFNIGAQVALPAASLCITKHLEFCASVRQTIQTASDKRRRKIFEFCLCVVLPCILMALHYIVQGHRFDIAEDFGCMPAIYFSWQALLVVYIPPLLLCLTSLIYASFAFVWFMKRRNSFSEHLQSCNSGLTAGRYMRLMAMAVTEIVIGTGLGTYVLGVSLQDTHLRIWDNWANVHSNFSRVGQFPRVLVPEFFWNRLLITWLIIPIGSMAFFVFFGFGEEAMAEYRRVILWFRTRVLGQSPKPSNDSVLPTFSAPRAPRVVHLDDLDMVSIDEKWDKEGAVEADATSSHTASTSQPRKTDDFPLRPLSAPPTRPTSSEVETKEFRASYDHARSDRT